MECVLERLKLKTKRDSTSKNYFHIWRKFSEFMLKLDQKSKNWEDRLALYEAYLIEGGIQSSTLKSYFSAIKCILREDNQQFTEEKLLLSTLTKACRVVNDCIKTRLPIHGGLLEVILFEISRQFGASQPYLECLYHTLFLLGYYSLFRIGELTYSNHTIKAKDFHIAKNKKKILIVLYTSKMHSESSYPQRVKITSTDKNLSSKRRFFYLFRTSRDFLTLRGNYVNDSDPFLVFRDNTPVLPHHARRVLQEALTAININHTLYNFHSLRIGRCSDLFKYGISVEKIKQAGHWKSNAVYKYIRNL